VIDPVARHVALFNEGVRTGDLTPWFNTFTDDAVLTFEGVPIPPAEGRAEIEAVYRDGPPGSEMSLTAGSPVDPAADTVYGEFFWVRVPETGGRFTLHLRGGRTSRIEIALNAPPPVRAHVEPPVRPHGVP
jgi:hypothetical protein